MNNWTKEEADKAQDRVNRLAEIKKTSSTKEFFEACAMGYFGTDDTIEVLDSVDKLTTGQAYAAKVRASNLRSKRGAPKTSPSMGATGERESGAARAQPQQRNQALGRLPKGVKNKTEAAYARHLEALKFAGEIIDYWFEEIKFKIGTSACWYEPDFLVQVKSGAMEIHECKGHWKEDALVKIKALALRHPFRVIAVRLIKGAWEIREFN